MKFGAGTASLLEVTGVVAHDRENLALAKVLAHAFMPHKHVCAAKPWEIVFSTTFNNLR